MASELSTVTRTVVIALISHLLLSILFVEPAWSMQKCEGKHPIIYVPEPGEDSSVDSNGGKLRFTVYTDIPAEVRVFRDGVGVLAPIELLPAGNETELFEREFSLSFYSEDPNTIALSRGWNEIVIQATDIHENCASVTRHIAARSDDIYAVLVAFEEYQPTFNPLQYPIDDLQEIDDHLRRELNVPSDNIRILTTREEVSEDKVLTAIQQYASSLDSNSTVLFYFSGHGFYSQDAIFFPDQHYLAMADTVKGEDFTFLSRAELLRVIRRLNVRNKIVMIDACFSGTLTTSTREIVADAEGIAKKAWGAVPRDNVNSSVSAEIDDNTLVIFSSRGNEVSWEIEELGHSLFTYFLVKAAEELALIKPDGSVEFRDQKLNLPSDVAKRFADAKEDGVITLQEAVEYASWRLPNYLGYNKGLKYQQNPEILDEGDPTEIFWSKVETPNE